MIDARRAHADAQQRLAAGDLAGASNAFANAVEGYKMGSGADDELNALCDALHQWAEVLTMLGQPQTAVARGREAVNLLRQRSMLGDGTVPSPQAAVALLVLGTAEFHAGEPTAGADLDAAMNTARRLVTALPTDDNQELLAHVRNHQSSLARAAGLLSDALDAAAESVDIRTKLAARNPAQYQSKLGSSLNNLASIYGDYHDFPRAAKTAIQACEVLTRRAQQGDSRAAINLAAAQSNAAAFLGDVPDLDLAIRYGTDAVDTYRQLRQTHPPPAFVIESATALVVLATCVAGHDDFESATALSREATELLVQHAGDLAPSGLAFLYTAVRHYIAFSAESGTAPDDDVVNAAQRAMTKS